MSEPRPLWVEIDLAAIRHNVRQLLAANKGRALLAVVKADAYGHGAIEVARVALSAGAAWLGVVSAEEGAALRRAGITAPILILGAFFPGEESFIFSHRLTPAVATEESLVSLCRWAATRTGGEPPTVHLKVDTGMGRLGFRLPEVVRAAGTLAAHGVRIDGLFTHLATADEADLAYAHQQLAAFAEIRRRLLERGIAPRWLHAGNSAALARLPMAEDNMVRSGISLYGLYPSPAVPPCLDLRPALSFKARVVAVRRLPAGSTVSYGATYVTKRETNIVTLPVGYADGYNRLFSNKGQVLLGGKKFPIAGRITMNLCMVDAGDHEVKVGEEAVLLGRQGDEAVTADDLAAAAGTINYEILCMIGRHVPRLYIDSAREADDQKTPR
ncbi:MAG TPA: alanine racemase [Firmicutes bacterium]|nr:alanine racemase [Bacillota bacterium]